MKLDPRIIKGKRPLTCFDTEEAKHFIGKKGFVAGELTQFCDLSKTDEITLKNVWTNEAGCFVTSLTRYKYFLPSEWVQEPENKWRPFSINEWKHDYGVGYGITFRIKNSDTSREYMCCGILSDHDDDLPGKGVINLGGELFVLQNLFDLYELYKDGKWQPFGVEK